MLFDIHLSPQRQAHIYATSLLAIITLGTLALIAVCFAALWAVVELATVLLATIVETCAIIGATYASADPMVKFLLLCMIGLVVYHAGRRMLRRA